VDILCYCLRNHLFIVVTKTECVKFFMLLLSNIQKAMQLTIHNYKLVLMYNCSRITVSMDSNNYNII